MGTVNKNVDNGCYFLNFHLSWEDVVDHKPHDKRGRLVLNVPGWPASGRAARGQCTSPSEDDRGPIGQGEVSAGARRPT